MKNHEDAHRLLLEANVELVSAANKIHRVIVMCVDASRHKEEERKLKLVVERLGLSRNYIDDGALNAVCAITELLNVTGCDGSCNNPVA
jgi:hypothetical protein